MILQVFFGEAQTGLGYQFYDKDGTLLGSRVTTGIDSLPEAGGYAVEATPPGGTVGIFWDSTETPDGVSEDLREALREGAPTVEEIADAVWDEAIADHQTAGSTGEQLQAAGDSGDPWATTVPGDYADGTAGAAVGRLNNTPAENPVAIIPAPPANPDLAAVFVDTEDILGAPVTNAVIQIELVTTQPATTEAGRVVGNHVKKMTHEEGTPGRYTVDLETGLKYRAKCAELFGPDGKTFTLETTAETLNLAD